MHKKREKIVISGCGVISPIGIGLEEFKNSLKEKRVGLKKLDSLHSNCKSQLAGYINNFQPEIILKDPHINKYSRIVKFSLCATSLALKNAEFNQINKETASRIGIIYGTETGPIEYNQKIYHTILKKHPSQVDPLLFSESVFNAPIGAISMKYKITGPGIALPMGLSSVGYCFFYAILLLKNKIMDIAIVGVAGELTPLVHKSYCHLKVLSPLQGNEEEGAKPFDRNRNGIVLSEGACFFILERESSALERKKVLAYIESVAVGSDAYKLADNNPSGEGLVNTINLALNKAKLKTNKIDYIIANALGSPKLDLMEALAIKKVFKEKIFDIPITSIKGSVGESSASGAMNIATALVALKEQLLFPTVGCENLDKNCKLNITKQTQKYPIKNILINNYGFGGLYSTIILQKP